ncbi:filamentous hemagglutinin N-terminal domain-containing protein [Robbsia sp. Bb-Pol-6]|uniref:Filamentous hemagglutinin N-terminal domain-containing protein n=1 Tax=Robbsia betulipollinis TaxID=2981849 RepID=A0ABT3ZHT9_9BURK|nr:filamentous hemagglutinin N-terminal domain-containing protein [Robbsia betulipollinis]MCY0385987.1 filamentous hemagglutinin N-terminal domain-containing protein [Robbsia betulipollinis]
MILIPLASLRYLSGMLRRTRGRRLPLLGALLLCDVARAVAPDALPVDGLIREGGIAITRDACGMEIRQTGERAIVDWRSFDVGRDASLRIAQPSAAAMLLNRVRGETGSTIAGQLHANGRVYLVNPNGIRISSGGTVHAAGFVAATLDIANHDFMSGNLHFGALGQPSTGTVIHDGRIAIAPGGFAALLGHRIVQTGTTRALLGQTGLGVGQAIRLLPGQDTFLEVTLLGEHSPADSGDLMDRRVGIVMTGVIEADGGLVQIVAPMATAHGRRPLEAVNLAGVVRARNAFARNGTIRVDGDGGIVRLSGRLDASSNEMHGTLHPGGTVEIDGQQVMMEDEGIDVSGALGGGRIRIAARRAASGDGASVRDGSPGPGGEAGVDPMVFVGAWARINASATYRGDAGDVALVSDGRVVFLGRGQALGAASAPGPSRLTVVAETAVHDTAHRGTGATTSHAPALANWQPSPRVEELPSLRWTPSPIAAPAWSDDT